MAGFVSFHHETFGVDHHKAIMTSDILDAWRNETAVVSRGS